MRQIVGGMLLAGAVSLFAFALYNTAWLSDDAYISYRSMDNLVHGYGLTWNTEERVQAFTNPLWVFVNLPAYLCVKTSWHLFFSGIVTSVVVALLAMVVLALGAAETPMVACFAVVALTFSRAFVDYSTSGLENPMTHLLLALFMVYLLRLRWTPGVIFSMALCAGLSLVNRMDTALIYAPVLAYAWLAERNLRATAAIAAGMLPFIAWEVFSVVYYGFPFPNTAYAKLGTGIADHEMVAQGLWYFWNAFTNDPLTIVLIVAGLLVVPFALKEGKYRALALGGLLYSVYLVKVGGDFMQGRLLTPVLMVAVLLLVRLPRGGWFAWGFAALVAVLISALAPNLPISDHAGGRKGFDARRVADERDFWKQSSGLKAWRATVTPGRPGGMEFPVHKYADTGRSLAALDSYRAEVFMSVGFRGFFSGPKVHVIDKYALADALLARIPAQYAPEWRIGHFTRFTPAWYVERKTQLAKALEAKAAKNRAFTVEEAWAIAPLSEDVLTKEPAPLAEGQRPSASMDPRLMAYYDRLEWIIRGPLWSPARWKAILNINLGRYDYLVDQDLYRFPEMNTRKYAEFSTPKPNDTKWNAPGNVILPRNGIEIQLEQPAHNSLVEMSGDGNDVYRLLFMNHGKIVGQQECGPAPVKGNGLYVYSVTVPNTAIRASYDAVRIVGYGGDDKYAVGHFRFP